MPSSGSIRWGLVADLMVDSSPKPSSLFCTCPQAIAVASSAAIAKRLWLPAEISKCKNQMRHVRIQHTVINAFYNISKYSITFHFPAIQIINVPRLL